MVPLRSRGNSLGHQIITEDIMEMNRYVEFMSKQIDELTNMKNVKSFVLSQNCRGIEENGKKPN